MAKSFQLSASTINGEIQEYPVLFDMPCDEVTVVGTAIVRDYDSSVNFIIAVQVLLILYKQNVFGTTEFKNAAQFYQYLEAECQCCPTICSLMINGCNATVVGCYAVIDTTGCFTTFFINGCNATINGCGLTLLGNN